jgi:transcriptional regulator with XRE-family HTH domain
VVAFKTKPDAVVLEGLMQMSRGERIRLLRAIHKLTQEELASKLSKSRTTVIGWEQDKVEPDLDSTCIMAEEFGVPVEMLVKPQESL